MCDSVEAAFNSAWREAGLPADVAPSEAPAAPAASTGGASKQSKKSKKKAASSDSDEDIPSPARKRRKPAGKHWMPEAHKCTQVWQVMTPGEESAAETAGQPPCCPVKHLECLCFSK